MSARVILVAGVKMYNLTKLQQQRYRHVDTLDSNAAESEF